MKSNDQNEIQEHPLSWVGAVFILVLIAVPSVFASKIFAYKFGIQFINVAVQCESSEASQERLRQYQIDPQGRETFSAWRNIGDACKAKE